MRERLRGATTPDDAPSMEADIVGCNMKGHSSPHMEKSIMSQNGYGGNAIMVNVCTNGPETAFVEGCSKF